MYERNKKKTKKRHGVACRQIYLFHRSYCFVTFPSYRQARQTGKILPSQSPRQSERISLLAPLEDAILSRVGGVDGDVSAGVAVASKNSQTWCEDKLLFFNLYPEWFYQK